MAPVVDTFDGLVRYPIYSASRTSSDPIPLAPNASIDAHTAACFSEPRQLTLYNSVKGWVHEYALWPMGGFAHYCVIPARRQEMNESLTALQKHGWITEATRAVNIDAVLKSKNSGLIVLIRLTFEFLPTGRHRTSKLRFIGPTSRQALAGNAFRIICFICALLGTLHMDRVACKTRDGLPHLHFFSSKHSHGSAALRLDSCSPGVGIFRGEP